MFLTDSSAATTPGLELEVIETGGQLLVQIVAAEPLTAEAVLFELNYSPARYSPQVVQATDVFAAPADSLCIEVMDIPGVVSFGQVSLGVAGQEIQAGGVLADVLFSTEPLDAVRVAADVPVHSGALCPLTCDAKAGDLTLHYVNPGDYDQNGLVSVSDLVPLGRHFRESGPFEFGSALSVADGNRNGQIEVADLSVIGRNWGHNVAAFNF